MHIWIPNDCGWSFQSTFSNNIPPLLGKIPNKKICALVNDGESQYFGQVDITISKYIIGTIQLRHNYHPASKV